jgi:hypothetical protein
MWTIIELFLALSFTLFTITEFFYPLIMGKPLFGSFRKSNTSDSTRMEEEFQKNNDSSFKEKINTAKQKVAEVKTVQNEVTEYYKSAEQLKEESDNLLK